MHSLTSPLVSLLVSYWKAVVQTEKKAKSFDMSTNAFIYPFPFCASDTLMHVCMLCVFPYVMANSSGYGKKKWAKQRSVIVLGLCLSCHQSVIGSSRMDVYLYQKHGGLSQMPC